MTKKDDSEDWVEVAETGKHELATLIAGLLQSEGIPAEVEGGTANPLPETIGAFGNSRVTVPPDRVGEARALIKSREKDFGGSRETDPIGRPTVRPDKT